MIHNTEIVTNEECHMHHHCGISWSALFAGALVGIGLAFLLHLFSIAIGLSAYSSTPDGATAITIGGLLGILIGVIVSMGVGGYVAACLGSHHHHYYHHHHNNGVIYGFVTWSLALALSALLVMPVTRYMAFYQDNLNPVVTTNVVTTTTTTKAEPVKKVVQNVVNKTTGPVTPTTLAWGGWLIFVLFFIGALSSCIGACCATCRKEEILSPTVHRNTPM